MLFTVDKRLFITTITKPPEAIVDKISVSVLFLSSCFYAVGKSLPRYYLNDPNDNQNLDAIFKISYSLHNGVKYFFEFAFASLSDYFSSSVKGIWNRFTQVKKLWIIFQTLIGMGTVQRRLDKKN